MPVLERNVTDLEAALREAVDTLFPDEKTYETAAVIVPDEKTAERAFLILREILAEKDFDCEKRLSWLMMQAQYIAATRALHELRVYHI